MLKIKDYTTKQNLSLIDITFWNNEKIFETLKYLKSIRNKIIFINDNTVNYYNLITNSRKSNASFVRQIRKLNKEGYFDER